MPPHTGSSARDSLLALLSSSMDSGAHGHAVSSGVVSSSLLFDDDDNELLSESSGALETGDFNGVNQGDAGGGGVGYASMAASLEEEYRKHIVDLEEKVASLAEESAIAAEAHVLELKRRDDETAALLDDVAQLKEAHEQILASSPALKEQLEQAKTTLREGGFDISEAQYENLKPQFEKLPLSDVARVVVHEQTRVLRAELESLRVKTELATQAAARADDEVNRLSRENARLNAVATSAQREANVEATAVGARLERLEKDLEDATVRMELMKSKAAMYDDAASRAEAAERRAQGLEAAVESAQGEARRAETQLQSATAEMASLRHRSELLASEKAHLAATSDDLRRQVDRLTDDVALSRRKLADVKKERADLRAKILSDAASVTQADSDRIAREVAKVQDAARAEIDSVRSEVNAAHESECRALRDMRDTLMGENKRVRTELDRSREEYNTLLVQHRSEMASLESRLAEATGQLRVSAFEVERKAAELEDVRSSLSKARAEVDMLRGKARAAEDAFHALELSHNRNESELQARLNSAEASLLHYQRLESDLDKSIVEYGAVAAAEGSADGNGAALAALALPSSLKRRVDQALELSKRCAHLERRMAKLSEEKATAEKACADLRADLARARRKEAGTNRPQAYLVDALARAEDEAAEWRKKCESLDHKVVKLTERKATLKRELENVLRSRSNLETMGKHLSDTSRRLLSTAVH